MKNKRHYCIIVEFVLFILVIPYSVSLADNTSPLCFTARGGNVAMWFDIKNVSHTIQYSNDGISWNNYASGTIITLTSYQSVYFRAASNQTTATAFGSTFSVDCSRFCFSSSNTGKVECSGNIMSLYGPDCPNLPLEYCAFAYLFIGCECLEMAPLLPASTLAEYSYYNMFNGCTSLKVAPSLPAMNLADYCYSQMFNSCTSISEAPSLPATILAESCYSSMFYGCSSLKTLPMLPSTVLVRNCYRQMFKNCSSLIVNMSGLGKQWIISDNTTSYTYGDLYEMFTGTGGTMNSTPSANTTYYIASDFYKVVANVNDWRMGSVSGAGNYLGGDVASLTAIANQHYSFSKWDNEMTSSTINFTVNNDTSLTAIFKRDTQIIVASGINGTVQGSGPYPYGDTAIITAIADEHFHFIRWSDGDTSNPRAITVNSDSSFMALFEIDRHSVYSTNEMVSGTGEYDYGSAVTLIARSDKHRRLLTWDNGSTDSVYSFIVVCDTVIDVTYDYDVLSIMATGDNGYVDGCGEYKYLDYATLTAVPNEYYKFLGWSDGTVINPYTFQVLDDVTLEAYFEKEVGIENVQNDKDRFYIKGGKIYNPTHKTLRVYSIEGKLIAIGNRDIVMDGVASGIYVVVDEDGRSVKVVIAN